MNILILTTHLNLGGIGVYTRTLASALKRRGETVIVASSGGDLLDQLKKNGIEHIDIPVNTSADIGIHTLISYFKLLPVIKRYNIQIIHAQTRVTQIIASLLSNKTKAVFISTCHGFFKRKLFRKIFPCWGKRVIAISEAVREHLVNDMGVLKEDIRVIYNGIETERFNRTFTSEDKSLIRNEYRLRDAATIGIIARLSEVKGHRYLFLAFAKVKTKFPDVQLLVVGDGPHKHLEDLKRLANKLGIENDVVFHDACYDTSLPLSVIDIYCSPSIHEGLGLAILEAMAMGIPVVASDVGGIYTLVKHNKNGILVPPKDESALARAIMQILANKPMAKEMGGLSKEIVREKFTLDIMTDKVLALYKETVDA